MLQPEKPYSANKQVYRARRILSVYTAASTTYCTYPPTNLSSLLQSTLEDQNLLLRQHKSPVTWHFLTNYIFASSIQVLLIMQLWQVLTLGTKNIKMRAVQEKK